MLPPLPARPTRGLHALRCPVPAVPLSSRRASVIRPRVARVAVDRAVRVGRPLGAVDRAVRCRSLLDAGLTGDNTDTGVVASEARSLRRLAWASFWSQLALSTVAAVVLWFCVVVDRAAAASPPFLATATTTAATAAALVSTFIAFGLTRATRGVILRGDKVRRAAVAAGALAATRVNLWGLAAALVGLQATIGGLVGRTLVASTTSIGASLTTARAAPVALDVFALQATANALLAHFASVVFATWVIRLMRAAAVKEAQAA